MKTIAYLVYGDNLDYQLELSLSVSSIVRFLQKKPSDIQIMLIADKSVERLDLPVEYIRFTEDEFRHWTEDGKYPHAAKVHALIKALKECDGPVALVDTDTYFIDHPELLFKEINKETSVMHVNEGPIGGFDYWEPITKHMPIHLDGYDLSKSSLMYNSGVVGVCRQQIRALYDATYLIKSLSEISSIFSIEQFAVTTCLAKYGNIKATNNVINHYWGRQERIFVHINIRRLVKQFGSGYFKELVERPVTAGLPKLRFYDRLTSHAVAKWNSWDGNMKFAYLSYLAARSTKDKDIRAGWLEVSTMFLNFDDRRISDINKYFPLLYSLRQNR